MNNLFSDCGKSCLQTGMGRTAGPAVDFGSDTASAPATFKNRVRDIYGNPPYGGVPPIWIF